jgi:hypothetical protein
MYTHSIACMILSCGLIGTISRRMVTSSSVDEKRSTSKTRLSTQRSVGEKTESKPKPIEPDDAPKVAEQPGPFLLLSQVLKAIFKKVLVIKKTAQLILLKFGQST